MHLENELLPADAAGDTPLLNDLRDRINRVYDVAEAGLWLEGHVRVGEEEVADLVRRGEIAVARLGARVVGSVQIRQVDDETGGFGLLVADPEFRGIGVGRELVRFAEQLSRSRGLSTMQLELVVPREGTHPVKTFLHEWYSRLGYEIVRTEDFSELHPSAAVLLATACDLVVYRKPL